MAIRNEHEPMRNERTRRRKDTDQREKSFWFAVEDAHLYKNLINTKKGIIPSRQVLKSGSSMRANVEETNNAIGREDLSGKILISCNEAKATYSWPLRDIWNKIIVNQSLAIVRRSADSYVPFSSQCID